MRRRQNLLIGTAILCGSTVALAQTDGTMAEDPPPASPPAPAAPPAPETETVRLPPVVVTARKWIEELRDVPQSVTVVPESLIRDAGLRNLSDASIFVPNLHFTEFTARRLSFPFVRGIGSGQGDPAVTTYIDGVPQLSIGTTNQPLFDVERIEFLRGPQGTLYGRNSIGGLIHVISRRPTNTPEFTATGTFGNFDFHELSLEYRGPLVEDEWYLSLGGLFLERDGYTTNDLTNGDVDDRETFFGRAQLLWTPDEENELRFTFAGERTRDGGFVLSDLAGLRARPHRIAQDFEGVTERDLLAPSFTWTRSGATVDFTAVSAYQSLDLLETSDFDFSGLDGVRRRTEESLDAFTQEVRFASADGASLAVGDRGELKWLGGVLFFSSDSDRSAANEFRPGGVPFISPIPGTNTERGDFEDLGVGVFGQVTLTIDDRLDLTGGLRYDYESKEADLSQSFVSGGFPISSASQHLDESYDEFVPRFSAAYRWSDAMTTYALAARGFKAGGFNLSSPTGDETFGPETSWTYEAGVKTALWNDQVHLNAAIFYIDWDDMQLSQFDAMTGGFVRNAGASTSRGFELEAIARPADGFDLFGTFGYTDTEFDAFIDQFGADVSGKSLPFAPETTWSAGVQYTGSFDRATEFFVRGEFLSVGSFFYDAGNREEEGYDVVNVRAGFGGATWRLEAWVRNAFDTEYVPVAFQPNPADPTAFVGESGTPRTYGVTLRLTF